MSEIIDSIEKNTDILESSLESSTSTKTQLIQENIYLKNLVSNYLMIINKLNYEKTEQYSLEKTIYDLFQDNDVKKFKGKYILLKNLRLMLTLRFKISKEDLFLVIQNSKYFDIKTIKGKIYIQRI